MKKRGSGILCHISSLPSPFGIGDFGSEAYRFVDFLADSGQSFWQILPLNPTSAVTFFSPYCGTSAFAGNPLFISPEQLVNDRLLSQTDVQDLPQLSPDKVAYEEVARAKERLFHKAHRALEENTQQLLDYHRFCDVECDWLEDYALYAALRDKFNSAPIQEWPAGIRSRNSSDIMEFSEELKPQVAYHKFLQYLFFHQWSALKQYCHEKGIQLIGDFPFFMTYSASDVWCHPEYFKVDEDLSPIALAGSPPDSFSKDGQLFNGLIYNWNNLQKNRYSWWLRRFRMLFTHYDIIRIDHFRGLIAYWEIPQGEKTAKNGKWSPAPYYDFMKTLLKYFPTLPVIAEDLGMITPDVREAMKSLDIPGIKMLVFAFSQEKDPVFLPHNHINNCVVYTSTHDTNTCQGWFETASEEEKEDYFRYLGRRPAQDIAWEFIRMAEMSVADTAILQLQDVLGLGKDARMNTPGASDGNWLWRFKAEQLTKEVSARLAEICTIYDRS